MKNYKYNGTESGIPGLPHEISDEQAKADGLTDLLNDAIASGVYVEISAPQPKVAREVKTKKEIANG